MFVLGLTPSLTPVYGVHGVGRSRHFLSRLPCPIDDTAVQLSQGNSTERFLYFLADLLIVRHAD